MEFGAPITSMELSRDCRYLTVGTGRVCPHAVPTAVVREYSQGYSGECIEERRPSRDRRHRTVPTDALLPWADRLKSGTRVLMTGGRVDATDAPAHRTALALARAPTCAHALPRQHAPHRDAAYYTAHAACILKQARGDMHLS